MGTYPRLARAYLCSPTNPLIEPAEIAIDLRDQAYETEVTT
ncbi:hypothetical protein [Cryobacterium sp. Y62]|nr:hypothetical protein [Cryobacterium sp. Y62]